MLKAILIIYIILAVLYFCNMYRNTYKDIKLAKIVGRNPSYSDFDVFIQCFLRSVIFPIDFVLMLLRS